MLAFLSAADTDRLFSRLGLQPYRRHAAALRRSEPSVGAISPYNAIVIGGYIDPL